MSNTLLMLFHPDLAQSRVNSSLAAAAMEISGVEVVEYQHHEIDIAAECERLLAADRIVWQFPLQWYSTPPQLKSWQDRVLTTLFYLQPQLGQQLAGKPLLVVATAGNDQTAYHAAGDNLFPLTTLLNPLQATANRCALRWEEPFLVYRANRLSEEDLTQQAQRYQQRLRQWIG